MSSLKIYGFGVDPTISSNHFYVIIPADQMESIQVFERFNWTLDGEQLFNERDLLRVIVSRHKWNKISDVLTSEFNARLKMDKLKPAEFAIGGTPVEHWLGKEMMVLLWAIENCEPTAIATAIRDWKGLMPEERWCLYTMTSSSSEQLNVRRGW